MEEFTVRDHSDAEAIALMLNACVAEDRAVEVDGRTVKPRFCGGKVATVYMNGSLEVTVEGRQKHKIGSVWAKIGQSLTVETI